MRTRLQELPLETVSKQLEVNRGLGMQTVARDVEPSTRFSQELKREVFWVVQLGQIIRRHHDPCPYEREYATVENSSERVEYAIKLPGQGDEYVYLPIDSKFPLTDYYRLKKPEAVIRVEGERCRRSL